MFDLRSGITIEYIGNIENRDGGSNYTETLHKISALFEGIEVGYLTFTEYIFSDETSPSYLRIEKIEITLSSFSRLGIGQLMYKKMSEVYEQNYMNWPVVRTFLNPVAEYAFRKADSMGWINPAFKQEENMARIYDEKSKMKRDELMQQLPEEFRGPKIDSW